MAKLRKMLTHPGKNESGQGALAMVLILLMLGAVILTPLLVFMSTGLKAGQVYESKVQEFYAADAGVEDALWRIKNDRLPDWMLGNWGENVYDYEPYSQDSGDAPPYPDINVNDREVKVTIQPIWVLEGLETPSSGQGREPHDSLVAVGNLMDYVGGEGLYQISLIYDGSVGNLKIERIGCWLPPGFQYVAGSSNLEQGTGQPYHCVPQSAPHKGGTKITWDYSPTIDYDKLPALGTKRIVTFKFTPDENPQGSFSWMMTTRSDIYLSWDADVKLYEVTSKATSASGKYTTVTAYTTKNEFRKFGAAISGDYRAIGNSLMIKGSGHGYNPEGIRYELLDESGAEVYDIPSDARVDAAYLYWSAWLAGEGAGEEILFGDKCSGFAYWDYGSDWRIGGRVDKYFEGHHSGSGGQELAMKSSAAPDLGGYSEGGVSVSWQQWESGSLEGNDCLQYSFSGDDGSTWSDWQNAFCNDIGGSRQQFKVDIPRGYLTDEFTMRFKLKGFDGAGWWFSSEERCYIDNIKISVPLETIADTSVRFEINGQQVYFDEEGKPQQGHEEITASKWQVLENEPGEYSYACYLDVTELVQAFCDKGDGDNPTGNGRYIVGDVNGDTGSEWSYAAWSLIIIYSSPETKGHQLYLYDDFVYSGMDQNVDFDGDGQPGGTISGFLVPDPIRDPDTGELKEVNAAKITCFVGEGDDYYDDDYMVINADEVKWDGYDWTISGGKCLSDGKSTDDVWNSWSEGLSEDGIDIDTFNITWDSRLLEPGDTSAQIDLPTETDSWNLVYIILSFRSKVTTGGTISYLIRGGG